MAACLSGLAGWLTDSSVSVCGYVCMVVGGGSSLAGAAPGGHRGAGSTARQEAQGGAGRQAGGTHDRQTDRQADKRTHTDVRCRPSCAGSILSCDNLLEYSPVPPCGVLRQRSGPARVCEVNQRRGPLAQLSAGKLHAQSRREASGEQSPTHGIRQSAAPSTGATYTSV